MRLHSVLAWPQITLPTLKKPETQRRAKTAQKTEETERGDRVQALRYDFEDENPPGDQLDLSV